MVTNPLLGMDLCNHCKDFYDGTDDHIKHIHPYYIYIYTYIHIPCFDPSSYLGKGTPDVTSPGRLAACCGSGEHLDTAKLSILGWMIYHEPIDFGLPHGQIQKLNSIKTHKAI